MQKIVCRVSARNASVLKAVKPAVRHQRIEHSTHNSTGHVLLVAFSRFPFRNPNVLQYFLSYISFY